MFKFATLGAAATLLASAAAADPVENRRAAMDQVRVGATVLVPMLKGEAAFDARLAELALRMTYAGAIAFSGPLFPDGTTSKGANPDIWAQKADFDARRADFLADAKAAVANLPTDAEGMAAVYRPLLEDCAGCHKPYRIKDN